jgi:hypothetical protein
MKKENKRLPYPKKRGNSKNDKFAVERRNARLLAFANAYIVLMIKHGPDKGAGEAAKAMGISTTAAYNWLKTDVVREIIKEKTEKALLKYLKTPDDVLSEVALIAFSDMKDYFEKDKSGSLILKDIHSMGDNSRVIKKLKHNQRIIPQKDAESIVENEYEYEMCSKVDCLKILAQFHKLIMAKQNEDREDPNNQANVIIYLPDNGFGGDTPIKGVRFGQPKQIECEVVNG